MIVLIIAYILITIKINIKDLGHENSRNSRFLNLLLRISTDYFQVLSTVLKNKVDFGFGIASFFAQLSMISDFLGNIFSSLNPLECLYRYMVAKNNGNVFYVSLFFITILFPIIFIVNLLFWIVLARLKKTFFRKYVSKCFTSIFLISYMLQPSFVNAFLKYINCVRIGETLYVRSYLLEKCWVDTHLFYFLLLILPSLIFWMFIYPLAVLNLLQRGQKKRNSNNFSFFTDGLKPQFYYWEIFLMFRKYVFIILSVFSLNGTSMTFNVWIMGLFSFFTLLFQIQKNPFEFSEAVKISLFANVLILASVISILLLLINDSTVYQLGFVSSFVFFNTAFVWKWSAEIYKIKKKKLKERINYLSNSFKAMIKKAIHSLSFMKKKSLKFTLASPGHEFIV